jgi:hypothetical protein
MNTSASPKPPYIEKIDERGNLTVWIVDGSYIRGHIDEEFTNFGQHYRYSYIPLNELWLDQEAKQNERQFFIDHLLVEYHLMAKGMSYDDALVKGDAVERRERRLAGDIERMTNSGQNLPDAKSVHDHLWKKLENGVSVWIVKGRLVRSVYNIDFTEGGHDHVYEFVPKNEVWIDDDIEEPERGYVLLHELHERNRMAHGWAYLKAHTESSRLEYRCRHHPDELHDALSAEGWG